MEKHSTQIGSGTPTTNRTRTPFIFALFILGSLLIPSVASARPCAHFVIRCAAARGLAVTKVISSKPAPRAVVVAPAPRKALPAIIKAKVVAPKKVWIKGHWKRVSPRRQVWVKGHWKVVR